MSLRVLIEIIKLTSLIFAKFFYDRIEILIKVIKKTGERVMNIIKINNIEYEVVDAINNITLADSFLLNKTGTANGEAKMYLGNESETMETFLATDTTTKKGLFLSSDFQKMLQQLKMEYYNPTQKYQKQKTVNKKKIYEDVTENMGSKWIGLESELNKIEEYMFFDFFRAEVDPPRVYINSKSDYYKLLRDIGIPHMSYCSILKLKNMDTTEEIYYFKPFVNHSSSLLDDYPLLTAEERLELENMNLGAQKPTSKQVEIAARIGQGKYRDRLLKMIPYCPFTQIDDARMLIASHIKPWRDSSDEEKIDPKNGLILSPTFDKLFDTGLITFESDGTLLVSPFLSEKNQERLRISTGINIGIEKFFSKERITYMEFHRENIFQRVIE
ncbi:HNH endonuclease [Vagococcus fluvialis]|uniref:HNH endonuclease n=2 Tax=Vagococcus fluvialis TaxID=2738 RepID=UPI003B5C102D